MRSTGWDGTGYDAVSGPQFDAGTRVVERLGLRFDVADDAVIVDAGCGSGRVTELILDTYPRATVVAIDASASMLAAAEKRLGRHAARLDLVQADLADTWPLPGPADAVVSTSTFHWVLDHDRLFAATFDALRPGGRLVAVAGGSGSLRAVRDAARSVGVAVDGINNYADAAPTAERLRRAGFVEVRCRLEDEPARFATREALGEYLAQAALAPYDRGAELAPRVAERLVEPVADFVRLNIAARRPTAGT